MIPPPTWTRDTLQEERLRAIEAFRAERLQEPAEAYAMAMDRHEQDMLALLDATDDLRHLDDESLAALLTDRRNLDAFRYLPGPPISEDDLKTLAQASSLSPKRLNSDSELVSRLGQVVLECLDKRRFPWVAQARPPSKSEKGAAILASAALMAYQRIQTARRSQGKRTQEKRVADALSAQGFRAVEPRQIEVLSNAPDPGFYCGESRLGTRKADFVVGLWDGRKLAIECKVSNSELNSLKRLNNDAAAKAEAWINDFGPRNMVPVAVLSGVYKLANLVEAQDRGLTLFWAHSLDAFRRWCAGTKAE